jgi:hypothetical protein
MRTLACATMLLALCGCGRTPATAARYLEVPLIQGGTVRVAEAEAHKITPLGWAMLLDRDRGTGREADALRAFDAACAKRPELRDETAHLLGVHGMIVGRAKARRR